MKVRRLLILLVLLALIIGGWFYVAYDSLGDVPVPPIEPTSDPGHDPKGKPGGRDATPAAPQPWDERRARLHAARRLCRLEPLEEFLGAQRLVVEAAKDPIARGQQLHVLAEGLLERIYCRNSLRGMTPGEPLYAQVPKAIRADVREGLALLEEARKLGVELADGYRVEAGLRTSCITGKLSALGMKGRLNTLYKRALELDGDNPRLHVALGCMRLLSPKFLGQDLDKATEHLTYACSKLPHDERPRIFAAMAAYLSGLPAVALDWAKKAVAINPENVFARTVLKRLQAGESDPFGRDV